MHSTEANGMRGYHFVFNKATLECTKYLTDDFSQELKLAAYVLNKANSKKISNFFLLRMQLVLKKNKKTLMMPGIISSIYNVLFFQVGIKTELYCPWTKCECYAEPGGRNTYVV